ncbi:MAG: hypothetical protein R3Y05_04880 [bacterium]
MTYMTFKIKKDWLLNTILIGSAVANLLLVIYFFISIAHGEGAMIALTASSSIVLTAANVYLAIAYFKNYKVGLTRDSIRISDITTVNIPYTSIRSIKKDRQPSKYKLYDAVLVIKYNKYDSIRVNCDDLENVFDNLKEMVQKANLDKVVNNVVTNKDGSKEIQQNVAGQTKIIPATNSTTGQTIIKPASQMTGTEAPKAQGTMVRPMGVQGQTQNQTTQGTMVRPAVMPQQTAQTQGTLVRPVGQSQGALVRNNQQQVVRTTNPNQATQGTLVRPAGQPAGTLVRPVTTTTTVTSPNQTQVVPKKTITTTTTTTKPVTGQVNPTGQPQVQTNTITNPDGTKRVVTTTTTTKVNE